MAAQDYVSVVQQLYVSYFGRPADYFGLQNFTAQLDSLGAPKTFAELNTYVQTNKTSALATLVNSFNNSTESAALYGTDTTQVGLSKFVEAIYQNVLHREPDVAGWAYWVGEIQAGHLTRANAAVAITQGALDNTSAQGLLDAQTVTNKLTVATAFTADLTTVAQINGYSGDAAAAMARSLLSGVDSTTVVANGAFQPTIDATVATITAGPVVNMNLTTGVDTVVGGTGNDAITGTMTTGTAAATDTLNSLDSIDGNAGSNTLNLLVLDDGTHTAFAGLPAGVITKNIQTMSIRSAVDINNTGAAISGVDTVSVTQATKVTELLVGSSTAVSVSGVTAGGVINVDGGTSQTVTADGSAVTLGGATAATGAISLTETNTAGKVIAVDGGSGVSVTASGISANTATITVGANTAATGAVAVVATGVAYTSGTVAALGAIEVDGGTAATVIQHATSDASGAAKGTGLADTIVQGAVTVAGTKTTTVTVQQDATVTGVDYVAAVAGKNTVDTVTFTKMFAGDSITVDGLTFTAAKDLTAAQAASAFANLVAGADQGTAAASLGVYSGATSGNFNSGAVVVSGTSQTVVFTSADADGSVLAATAEAGAGGTVAPVAVVTTAGSASSDATDGVLGITAGAVTITSTDQKITTVNLDGYGASTIQSDGLTTLSLANSDATVGVTNTVATTLALTLNNVGSAAAAALTLGTAYTALNITTAGADSADAITAANVTALTVAGSNAVDLTGSTFTNLKTLTVTGAAGVTADVSADASVTAVSTAGTTGDSAITLDATKATFTGGAGSDDVTASAAITKAIALGAGDDSLTLSDATVPTATVDGGDGSDTLVFTTGVLAAAATSSSAFEAKVTGFEKLGVVTFGADATVDLHNMHDINYVVVGGGTAGTLTFSDMGANGTLELDGADTGTAVAVTLTDATGTSDVLNVVLKHSDKTVDTAFGVVKAAGIETINLNAVDTHAKSTHAHIVDVLATAAKSIVITGNANVTLTADAANVALTSVDGSAMTGKLTAETTGVLAETIKGSAAGNTLTANGTSDVLLGGAGKDTLIAKGQLDSLTGGGGADTFDVSHATNNVNSYATITDLSAGDTIVFAAATSFAASKVVLGDTAVFQDYANAAINASGANNALSWFQIGGNTYVVENETGTAHSTFTNGVDVIVKITGNVDLSHASLNSDSITLVIH